MEVVLVNFWVLCKNFCGLKLWSFKAFGSFGFFAIYKLTNCHITISFPVLENIFEFKLFRSWRGYIIVETRNKLNLNVCQNNHNETSCKSCEIFFRSLFCADVGFNLCTLLALAADFNPNSRTLLLLFYRDDIARYLVLYYGLVESSLAMGKRFQFLNCFDSVAMFSISWF